MIKAASERPVPADLAERVRSRAPVLGPWLTIRPVLPEDEEIETRFFESLSDRSRYNRFLGAGVRPDAAMIRRFTHIDYDTHMGIVATTMLAGEEVEIGAAQYVAEADGRAEFALVIADDWQGHGLGAALMTPLLGCARDAGFREIYGEVFGSNVSMLALMRRLGFEVHRHPESHELRLVTYRFATEPGQLGTGNPAAAGTGVPVPA